ncbi:vitamin B12-dependent ribonucleotide reductase [bacterium]|nr:vitamin B12-dependent ribonucleotide reductase [bacterium]
MAVKNADAQVVETKSSPKKVATQTINGIAYDGAKGLRMRRYFTTESVHPFDRIEWEKRSSVITEPDGTVVFEMKDLEFPKSWSQLATDIAASKYFRKAGVPGTGHETSVRQLVYRVAHTIRTEGEAMGYFDSSKDAEVFEMELTHLLVNQMGAFNSPVWFNCGLSHEYGIKGSGGNFYWDMKKQMIEQTVDSYSKPQCSACFIQSVGDDLMGIFELAKNEAKLFKYGSGTGSNFSALRGKQEKLSGGGTSSGLMSFLAVLDRGAGATKSGGTTRRAAKMVCLDMDHPEIEDFINWKVKEEKKVKALMDAGYDSDFNGEAYQTVSGQNSNNSVRVSDKFMNAVLEDGEWQTTARTTGDVVDTYKARELYEQVAFAAWACADPGVQFDDTINDWHTCPKTDKIHASNPCSEYMFLDDSACNLASINLMKLADENGQFDIEGYREACRIFIIAQEILVDMSSYPTQQIAQNSHDYRPLGLGYANLGTLLMVNGLPYDSEEGRAMSGAITAIMHAAAYSGSAEVAAVKGPFPGYKKNEKPMLRVMNKHRDAAYKISPDFCPDDLIKAAREDWDACVALGEKYGYRNAQATVLAPTGTIGLLMDCDTTGVEPEFSLVKWKKLAGGGYFKIVNNSIPQSLRKLGYSSDEIDGIIKYILGHGTFNGAPYVNPDQLKQLGFTEKEIGEAEEYVNKNKSLDEWTPHVNIKTLKARGLSGEQISRAVIYIGGAQTVEGTHLLKEEHLAVFDCANKCGIGKRFIDPMGHVKMMSAVQPFLSGAISKTVNIPTEATVKDIEKIYFEAWKLGLKAIALYRDGSKFSQPLTSKAISSETTTDGSSITQEQLDKAVADAIAKASKELRRGQKKPIPHKRHGFTQEVSLGGHKIYFRTGEYEDGQLGEIFIDMFKEGAAYRSLLNCFAVAVSMGLQYGVPLEKFVEKFTFTRFEPSGFTDHPNIKNATSILDFIFRVLGMEYLGRMDFVHVPPTLDNEAPAQKQEVKPIASAATETPTASKEIGANQMEKQLSEMMGDAPACDVCGHMTVRNGACYKCLNCGNSMGCS